jgi:hypothetical protein
MKADDVHDRRSPPFPFRNGRTAQSRKTPAAAAALPSAFRRRRDGSSSTNTNNSSAQAKKLCEICQLVCDTNRWNNAKDLNQLGSIILGTR